MNIFAARSSDNDLNRKKYRGMGGATGKYILPVKNLADTQPPLKNWRQAIVRNAKFNPKVAAEHPPLRPICRDVHAEGAILVEFPGLIANDFLLT